VRGYGLAESTSLRAACCASRAEKSKHGRFRTSDPKKIGRADVPGKLETLIELAATLVLDVLAVRIRDLQSACGDSSERVSFCPELFRRGAIQYGDLLRRVLLAGKRDRVFQGQLPSAVARGRGCAVLREGGVGAPAKAGPKQRKR